MFALEALANTVGGGLINWAVTWLLLGFTPAQSLGITALFFGISFARSYLLRRAFHWADRRRADCVEGASNRLWNCRDNGIAERR